MTLRTKTKEEHTKSLYRALDSFRDVMCENKVIQAMTPSEYSKWRRVTVHLDRLKLLDSEPKKGL